MVRYMVWPPPPSLLVWGPNWAYPCSSPSILTSGPHMVWPPPPSLLVRPAPASLVVVVRGPNFFFFLCCKPIGARRQFQGIHYRTLMVGCSSPVSSLQGPGGKYWLVDLAALCLTLPLFVALSRGPDTCSVLFCLKLALLAYTGQCCFTLFYSV